MTVLDDRPTILDLAGRVGDIVADPYYPCCFGWVKEALDEAATSEFNFDLDDRQRRNIERALDEASNLIGLLKAAMVRMNERLEAVRGHRAFGQLEGRLRGVIDGAPTEPNPRLMRQIEDVVNALNYLESRLLPALDRNVEREYARLGKVYEHQAYREFLAFLAQDAGGDDWPLPDFSDQPTGEELAYCEEFCQAFWAWFKSPERRLGLQPVGIARTGGGKRNGASADRRERDREFRKDTRGHNPAADKYGQGKKGQDKKKG